MACPLRFLFINGLMSAPADTPPVTALLESQPGAYTTTRTHNNGSVLLFWERHLSRLANSTRILIDSNPKLLFKPGKTLVFNLMKSSQFLVWDSIFESLVNDSMRRALPVCLKERRTGGEELAITTLVSGNLEDLSGSEGVNEEKILKSLNVSIHVGVYLPLVFGGRENGAHLAVVGHGRDVANAKYSDWVRLRKSFDKLRPPSATELLLSNDGDQILEGCVTNFFVVCRMDSIDDSSESKVLHNRGSAYPFEVQTAPISDGVLPGVVRQVIIDVCLRNGIPLREVAPSWSTRELWEEAFITISEVYNLFCAKALCLNYMSTENKLMDLIIGASKGAWEGLEDAISHFVKRSHPLELDSLRLLQHVETIQVPNSWDLQKSRTWKDVTWEEKQFEEVPGRITALIQKEIMEKALLEGYPVSSFND